MPATTEPFDSMAWPQEAARRIVAAVAPRAVILFGSRAGGTARRDADIDLLVVVDAGTNVSREALLRTMLVALKGIPAPVDLLVHTPQEVERLRSHSTNAVADAIREGRVLFGQWPVREADHAVV